MPTHAAWSYETEGTGLRSIGPGIVELRPVEIWEWSGRALMNCPYLNPIELILAIPTHQAACSNSPWSRSCRPPKSGPGQLLTAKRRISGQHPLLQQTIARAAGGPQPKLLACWKALLKGFPAVPLVCASEGGPKGPILEPCPDPKNWSCWGGPCVAVTAPLVQPDCLRLTIFSLPNARLLVARASQVWVKRGTALLLSVGS